MAQFTHSTSCSYCAREVFCSYWINENDPGDRGYIRVCGHGDYAPADSVRVVR